MPLKSLLFIFLVFTTSCGPGMVTSRDFTLSRINPFYQAYQFDGSSSFVTVSGLTSYSFSSLTVEFFFKTSTNVSSKMFSFGTMNMFDIVMNPAGTITINSASASTCTTPVTATSASSYNDGKVHYLAMTANTAAATLYIDGTQAGMVATGGWTSCVPTEICVGAGSAACSSQRFNGIIDEVRISNFVRYGSAPSTPTSPFIYDVSTLDIFHFDASTASDFVGGATWTYTPSAVTSVVTPVP